MLTTQGGDESQVDAFISVSFGASTLSHPHGQPRYRSRLWTFSTVHPTHLLFHLPPPLFQPGDHRGGLSLL